MSDAPQYKHRKNTNVVVITCGVTAEPRIQQQNGEQARAFLRLAVKDRPAKDDPYSGHTNYLDASAFGPLVEKLIAPHVHKGSRLAITGRLYAQTKPDRGENRTSVSITIEQLELLGQPGRNGLSQAEQQANESVADAPVPAEDPVPF